MNSIGTITVRGLGKRYRLGGHETAYRTLRDTIAGRFSRKLDGDAALQSIWALQNISLDVQPGEVLGIIGKNGAGKSTLLKILSRITSPTTGRVEMRGRVGSLLEVGTGFHPELSGRENIYLNGAILGESRLEIRRKFDEIVAFAEVERFIDTPVKHYSSGMYVRLAFAVAAFINVEIMIVDEALAVGDAAFQKKCLGRMGVAATEGRTILFVSHSMPAVESLCSRAIWVDQGEIREEGDPQRIIANYIESANQNVDVRPVGEYVHHGHRRGTGEIQFSAFRLVDSEGNPNPEPVMGETIRAEVEFAAHADVDEAVFSFSLFDAFSQVVVTSWAGRRNPLRLRKGQRGRWLIELPDNILRARKYYFSLGVTSASNSEIPFDIWQGGGTEFPVRYPRAIESLDYYVGHDMAVATMPVRSRFELR